MEEKSATKVLYDVSCLGGLDWKCAQLPSSTLEACYLWVATHRYKIQKFINLDFSYAKNENPSTMNHLRPRDSLETT